MSPFAPPASAPLIARDRARGRRPSAVLRRPGAGAGPGFSPEPAPSRICRAVARIRSASCWRSISFSASATAGRSAAAVFGSAARRRADCCSASTRSASCSFSPASRRRASAVPPAFRSSRSASFAIRRCASATCCDSSCRSPSARRVASGVALCICDSRLRSSRAACSPLPPPTRRPRVRLGRRARASARPRDRLLSAIPDRSRTLLRATIHLPGQLLRLPAQLLLLARQLFQLALQLVGRAAPTSPDRAAGGSAPPGARARSRIRSSALSPSWRRAASRSATLFS